MGLSERVAWSRMPLWLRALIAFTGYALAAEVGNRLSVQNAFSTFWPPAGLALALLVLSPVRDWPVLAAAMVAANISSDLAHGRTLLVSAGFATANGLEALAGAYLVRRFIGTSASLTNRVDTLKFGLWAVCAAPAVGATVGASVVALSFGGGNWPRTWATWWSGDALGVMVVGAFALVLDDYVGRLRTGRAVAPSPGRTLGFLALFALTCAAGAGGMMYLGPLTGWKFAIFLPTAVVSALFGTFGAAAICLGLAVVMTASLATTQAGVVLASGVLSTDVLVLQGFLAVITFTSLFLATAVDESHAATAAQRVLAEKYRVLLETLPIGVTISDADGAILETSREAQAILGISGDEQRDRGIDGGEWRLVHADGTVKPPEEWTSVTALREKRPVRGQEGVLRPDGSVIWLDVTAAPIPVEGYGVAITYNDVTEQVEVRERLRMSEARLKASAENLEVLVRERTAELERTNAELREASEAKGRFLANMSHELRTPLNSVIGFSGILEQGLAGPLNEEQAREVHMIRNSGGHLLALVNDLLDLTRIESGKADIECRRFDVSGLVDDLREMIGPLAAEKCLRLEVECAVPEIVMNSDRLRLSQILANLLTNAVKFTDAGGVELTCDAEADQVVFRVTDTGIGIAADEIPRIMEEFHQVDRPSDGMKPAGVGLGLPISHRLATLLGGTLSVESTLGAGTTFTVRVPVDSE